MSDDDIIPPQRLGLPRHLLVPGSREESTTEVDEEEQEEQEETEREEEEEDLELTFLCNPQVFQLKEEVEEGRRRLKECKVNFHKFSHLSSPPYSATYFSSIFSPPPGTDPEVERGQSADDWEGVEFSQPARGGCEERQQFLFFPGGRGKRQQERQFYSGGRG